MASRQSTGPDSAFEWSLRMRGLSPVAGLDEAGRGPLAGPVVAAAVILDMNDPIDGLNDSKKLSAKKRERLAHAIMHRSLAYAIVRVPADVIDTINILEATKLAMTRAVRQLPLDPGGLLLDAIRLPALDTIYQEDLIKGDARSLSIAAASILAKVARDRMMVYYDRRYPGYDFARHKGYGTRAHYEALDRLGPSPIHRERFLRSWRARRAEEMTHEQDMAAEDRR